MKCEDFWCMSVEEKQKLFSENPETAEKIRQSLLQDAHGEVPDRLKKKMSALQWSIDVERQKHKNPLGACVAVYGMMERYVYGPDGALIQLSLSWQDVKQRLEGLKKDIGQINKDRSSEG